MSKYARFIWRNDHSDHSIQLVDVIDMADAAYSRRPLLGCTTDEELLSKLFEPNKTQWITDAEWFEAVPQGVQNGATFTGTWPDDQMNPLKYENPDGTDGNGAPI